jgi:hypothetical protein
MKTALQITILNIAIFVMIWLALIIAVTPKEGRVIDCGMASFHPDYTPEIRKACQERFIKQ